MLSLHTHCTSVSLNSPKTARAALLDASCCTSVGLKKHKVLPLASENRKSIIPFTHASASTSASVFGNLIAFSR